MSLVSIVVELKDRIALNGSSGCLLSQFLVDQSKSHLSLTATQLLYILKRFLIPEGYTVSRTSGYTFQDSREFSVDALQESVRLLKNHFTKRQSIIFRMFVSIRYVSLQILNVGKH